MAAEKGLADVVKLLLQEGAEVNTKNEEVRIDMYVGPMYRPGLCICHPAEFHPT